MDIPTRTAPNAINYTPSETWLHLCALRLRGGDSSGDVVIALQVAAMLHSTWPDLDPEVAVKHLVARLRRRL